MDKTPVVARLLISNKEESTQQFCFKNSRRVVHETKTQVINNEKLENKFIELTSLVRQIGIS